MSWTGARNRRTGLRPAALVAAGIMGALLAGGGVAAGWTLARIVQRGEAVSASPLPAPPPLRLAPAAAGARAPIPQVTERLERALVPPLPERLLPETPLPLETPEVAPGGELAVPVRGVEPEELRDTYNEARGAVRHEALDIPAPEGTPVVAVADGTIRKLFTSKKGGLTIYQFDLSEKLCYYYAHLDAYAPGLQEGMRVRRGQVIGSVGSSGNAAPDAPHLHFEVTRLGRNKQWWGGEPLNPYPMITGDD